MSGGPTDTSSPRGCVRDQDGETLIAVGLTLPSGLRGGGEPPVASEIPHASARELPTLTGPPGAGPALGSRVRSLIFTTTLRSRRYCGPILQMRKPRLGAVRSSAEQSWQFGVFVQIMWPPLLSRFFTTWGCGLGFATALTCPLCLPPEGSRQCAKYE